MSEQSLIRMLNSAYVEFDGNEELVAYMDRHQIKAQGILTIADDEQAANIAMHLEPRIKGKTVVEIGGGLGLLSLHLGVYAKRVYCIEASPIWSSCFIAALLENKPKHVSYLFGAADEFAGQIKADVALFLTHSGVDSMKDAAAMFAPEVIDVYGELIEAKSKDFDWLAQRLRRIV